VYEACRTPGLLERAEAILEAILYVTDGDDIPSAVELACLALDTNWDAAHGDPDTIATHWALRHHLGSPTNRRLTVELAPRMKWEKGNLGTSGPSRFPARR
jgi:hypothetical protein